MLPSLPKLIFCNKDDQPKYNRNFIMTHERKIIAILLIIMEFSQY